MRHRRNRNSAGIPESARSKREPAIRMRVASGSNPAMLPCLTMSVPAKGMTVRVLLEAEGKLHGDVIAARMGDEIVDLHTPVSADPKEIKPILVQDEDALP